MAWPCPPSRPNAAGRLAAGRLAAGRRKCRVDSVPGSLGLAIAAFDASRIWARDRARRAGTCPSSNHTLETALSILRDLARFLTEHRGKDDWALIDVHGIEAFLATSPRARKRRLVVLRQFFRFARSRRIVLTGSARILIVKERRGFCSRTLPRGRQRELFCRWTTGGQVLVHEALLGMLALLQGASGSEVRTRKITGMGAVARTAGLGEQPRPVLLDPVSWRVLERCVDLRAQWPAASPRVRVAKGTGAGRSRASTACVSRVLGDCGYLPRMIRGTRLVDLVNTVDPELVAAVFGMDPRAALTCLAGHVGLGRLPDV
ncbi:site-specific integrase [Streptomyces sp. NPDC048045]|uniref:site-specific integrase n=1 Tax=Streptomyces sp. NPDC048045 TaxID=3154710 RepID=UPI00343548A3